MNGKIIHRLVIAFFVVLTNSIYAASIGVAIAPPANDDCTNATSLTVNPNYLCGTVTSGTLLGATHSSVASDGTLGSCPNVLTRSNDDVWFKFVATSADHKISLLNIAGSTTDLYANVYNGGIAGNCPSTAANNPIHCSDYDVFDLSSLMVGNTYFVRVYSNSTVAGATTTFNICLGSMALTPNNDTCDTADLISSLPHNSDYDASAATNNAGFITASGCIGMNDGVWFKMSGNGGDISIVASPNSWNLAIAVYSGTCGAYTCVGYSDNYTGSQVEDYTFSSVIGTEYFINIAYGGLIDSTEGPFNLAITSSTLSIDKILAKGFTYYPNPVGRMLKMNAKEPIQQISLYSVLGKEIKHITQNDTQAELYMDHLPAGTYFVKALVGGSSGSFKILKK